MSVDDVKNTFESLFTHYVKPALDMYDIIPVEGKPHHFFFQLNSTKKTQYSESLSYSSESASPQEIERINNILADLKSKLNETEHLAVSPLLNGWRILVVQMMLASGDIKWRNDEIKTQQQGANAWVRESFVSFEDDDYEDEEFQISETRILPYSGHFSIKSYYMTSSGDLLQDNVTISIKIGTKHLKEF